MTTSFQSLDRLNAQMDLKVWGAWFFDHMHGDHATGIIDSFGAYIGGGEL